MPTRGKFKFDVKKAQKRLDDIQSKTPSVFSDVVKTIGDDFVKRVKERMPYKQGALYQGLHSKFEGDKYTAWIRAMQSERQEILWKRGVGAVPPPFTFRNNPLGSDWEFGYLVDAGGAVIPLDRRGPGGRYFYRDVKAPNAQGFFSDTVDEVKRDWTDEKRLESQTKYSDWLD